MMKNTAWRVGLLGWVVLSTLLGGCAFAHEEGDGRHDGEGQQPDHDHRGQLIAKAQVGGQRRQAKASGETSDRAHP